MYTQIHQNYHHIETSQLIYFGNQLTGFYMMETLAFNELTENYVIVQRLQIPHIMFQETVTFQHRNNCSESLFS